MELEQILYEPKQTAETQKICTSKDLGYLSVTEFYNSGPLHFGGPIGPGGSGPLHFGGGSGPIGSSHFSTWLPEHPPLPKLEITTPKSYLMIDRQHARPSSLNSFTYFNDDEEPIGGINNLNSSEMSYLLKKHFGKF